MDATVAELPWRVCEYLPGPVAVKLFSPVRNNPERVVEMPRLLQHIALVTESSRVSQDSLSIVAAAMQKQVLRDFGPIWDVTATVDAFPRLEDVPIDYWKVMIMDDIGQDAAGVHLDDQGQPYALVTADSEQDKWSLTISHEILEMLADPFGNTLIAGDSPMEGQGRVQILVEVSDPCENASFGYSVNGVLVSDFYTPRYFDPFVAAGVQYSFSGAISEPREVLRGGYLSWVDPQTNDWWQQTWFQGNEPSFRKLGPLSNKAGSFRSQIDARSIKQSQTAISRGRSVAMAAGHSTSRIAPASVARAEALRQCIQELPSIGNKGTASTGKPTLRAARRAVKGD